MTPESYRERCALVLGGGGFIGRWVARGLCNAGARLHVTLRDLESGGDLLTSYGVSATLHRLDAGDPEALETLLEELRPEVVFNLVGYGVDRTERDEEPARLLNDELPGRLARRLASLPADGWAGARLVHVGSALEYGTLAGDLAEDSRPQPTTLYGRTKLAGTERVTRTAEDGAFRGTTARLFTVYGPGEHAGRLLPSLIEAARSGEFLDLTAGTQRRDFTYVEEVAEGLLRLGSAPGPLPPVVNLATGVLTPVRRFTELAAGLLGIPSHRLRFGRIPTRGEEMAHGPVSIAKLCDCLGWFPRIDIENGVRRALGFLEAGPRGPVV